MLGELCQQRRARALGRLLPGERVLTMIDFPQSSLQALPIQLALALVVELLPELLDTGITLVLRFGHLHLQLGDQVGALHLGCS